MLVQKGGIFRDIDEKRLAEYKQKGFTLSESKKKTVKKPENKKG